MARDDTLRALGRIKKEVDSPPLIFTAEGRENVRFVFWMVSGFISLIVTIVLATAVVISYRNDITQNKSDIALVKSEAAIAKALAGENKAELDRRREAIDNVIKQMAVLQPLNLPAVVEEANDMARQREYGINNNEWYRSKHNFSPPATPGALPRSP